MEGRVTLLVNYEVTSRTLGVVADTAVSMVSAAGKYGIRTTQIPCEFYSAVISLLSIGSNEVEQLRGLKQNKINNP